VALTVSVGLVTIGIASVAKSLLSPGTAPPEPTGQGGGTTTSTGTATTALAFPKVKVANISGLVVGTPVTFNYPLEETPNVLIKAGEKATGGIGPDSDIVAFSLVCQHLGCIWGFVPADKSPACDKTYNASGPVGYCCCHGSIFDLANGASVLDGPSPRPQPQVVLELDSSTGDIYATGMTAPSIFGHNTGSSNPLDDLKGGTPVS